MRRGRGGFDESKDVLLKSYPSIQSGDTLILIEAYSYSGGAVKLQLARQYPGRNGGPAKRGKLGRVTSAEALALIPPINQFAADIASGSLLPQAPAVAPAQQQAQPQAQVQDAPLNAVVVTYVGDDDPEPAVPLSVSEKQERAKQKGKKRKVARSASSSVRKKVKRATRRK